MLRRVSVSLSVMGQVPGVPNFCRDHFRGEDVRRRGQHDHDSGSGVSMRGAGAGRAISQSLAIKGPYEWKQL